MVLVLLSAKREPSGSPESDTNGFDNRRDEMGTRRPSQPASEPGKEGSALASSYYGGTSHNNFRVGGN